MSILRIILAIILPPLGVFMTVGIKGAFWLNILLTILGFIPNRSCRLGDRQKRLIAAFYSHFEMSFHFCRMRFHA